MPAIPGPLVLADLFRNDKGQAIVLPFAEPTAHRIDSGVSEILERLCGQRRPHPAGTIDDDRLLSVRKQLVRFYFKKAAGKENGLVEMSLLPFVTLSYI